ncbi:class I SAM-dependent methyltransferase [bacterium]|nr:class I SAM-dependent methyltransferase [bacterium]
MKQDTAKKLLKKVHDDYLEIADSFSKTRNHPWHEFSSFKKYIKEGDRILDLGCGNGRLYTFLKDIKNISYTGIDNNETLITYAQKNYPSTNFVVGNLLQIPFHDEADILFSIASLHHIPSSDLRNKSIQETNRVLKKNGYAIFTVWNLFQKRYRRHIIKSLFNFIVHFGEYDWNDTFIPWGKTNIKRYYHAFTPNELRKLFKKNGFNIVKMFYTKNNHNICLICQKK